MRGLIYYLPGRSTVSEKEVIEAGLAYALEEGGPQAAPMASGGPDTGSGTAFTLPAANGEHPNVQPLVAAARDTWQQIPGSKAWVGFDPKAPPGPEDLARRQQVRGHPVTLADGRRWQVPVLCSVGNTTRLPRTLAWDGAQWAPGQVVRRYAELFGAAQRIWDALVGALLEGESEASFSEECNLAAQALAVNYRLGPAEISLLGLLDTAVEEAVVMAAVDWPALEELKKKLAAAESSSTPGGAGS